MAKKKRVRVTRLKTKKAVQGGVLLSFSTTSGLF